MSLLTLDWPSPQVAQLTLSRPDRGNALDDALIDALTHQLRALSATDARALVLSGQGRHLCAGADLDWMQRSLTIGDAANQAEAARLAELFEALDAVPVPVLAEAKGSVFGGGLGLLACADHVIALEGTRFSFSEARLGLVPAVISPYVVRAIGLRQARRHLLAADVFDAGQALRLGLVHEVVTPEQASAARQRWLETINRTAPQASRHVKALLRRLSAHDGLQQEQPANQQLIARVRASPEGQEGLQAFAQGRPPAWLTPDQPFTDSL